jgi:hypothetical protein
MESHLENLKDQLNQLKLLDMTIGSKINKNQTNSENLSKPKIKKFFSSTLQTESLFFNSIKTEF